MATVGTASLKLWHCHYSNYTSYTTKYLVCGSESWMDMTSHIMFTQVYIVVTVQAMPAGLGFDPCHRTIMVSHEDPTRKGWYTCAV